MTRLRRGRPGAPSRSVTRDAVRKDLLVFVEGERTEEDYLVFWHRIYRDRVTVNIDPFRGAPRQLIDRAVQAKKVDERDARRGRGRAYDAVWCCFDVDAHPRLDEVATTAEAHGIGLAVSNPCVELWFLLHCEPQTAYLHRRDAQRRSAAALGCRKGLSADALRILERQYGDAKDRALQLDHKHRGDGSPAGENPSSSVWRLVDAIRAV